MGKIPMLPKREDVLRKTIDPPAPKWPVKAPQIQPNLRKKGPKIGGSRTPKGGKR